MRSKGKFQLLLHQGGQATLLAAFAMTVLLAAVGLAIDVGRLHYIKRHFQSVADAAAIAAGLEIRTCGTSSSCPVMQSAAKYALQENGVSGASFLTNCGSAGSDLTLTLNQPACALGGNDPNSGNAKYVEAVVSQDISTYFARLVGFSKVRVSARAEATRGGGPCVYALDPTGVGITMLAGFTASCGVVDESASNGAALCVLGFAVAAPSINISGGDASLLCATHPHANLHMPAPITRDPLAYIPKPSDKTCGTSLLPPYHGSSAPLVILAGNVTLYPDKAYCGGITIGPLATVHFMPGTYVLKETTPILGLLSVGTGLAITIGANVTGTDVMFYNKGPAGLIAFAAGGTLLGSVDLEAPTTGTYGGILFYQDPANTNPAALAANLDLGNQFKLVGGLYFPTATVTYAADSSPYNYIVAKDIIFAASLGTVIRSNYASLAVDSPIGGDYAVLVQ